MTFKIVNQVLYFRNGPDYESPPLYVSDNKYTAELVLSDKEHNDQLVWRYIWKTSRTQDQWHRLFGIKMFQFLPSE